MTAPPITLLLAASLAGVTAAGPEWAPVAINAAGDALYLVDRASIRTTPETSAAVFWAVSPSTALRLHVDLDCAGRRQRFLDAASVDGALSATPWAPIRPATPIARVATYVCAGGKVDLGLGDMVIRAPTPEAFARAFLKRRAEGRAPANR